MQVSQNKHLTPELIAFSTSPRLCVMLNLKVEVMQIILKYLTSSLLNNIRLLIFRHIPLITASLEDCPATFNTAL